MRNKISIRLYSDLLRIAIIIRIESEAIEISSFSSASKVAL
jgi:hypothetical protein